MTDKQIICKCNDKECGQCSFEEQLKAKEQELDQLKAENKHLNDLLNQALKELEKTRETLTEIKEIAENGKRFAERWMITGEQKANVLTYANAILQKISEVENESNI